MADLTRTANEVGAVIPANAEMYNVAVPLSSTLQRGQPVYFDASGNAVASDASAAGTAKFAGIVVERLGRGLTILKRGHIGGFNLSGLAYGAKVYLSDTTGELADAAGTVSVIVGSVVPISDDARTKVLYIEADWKSL